MIPDQIVALTDSSYLGVQTILEAEPSGFMVEAASEEQIHHPLKILEWYYSRALLRKLVNHAGLEFKGIVKNDHGKPFDPEDRLHISLSHSFPQVAAVISDRPVGIDIEAMSEQMSHISRRYCMPSELDYADSIPALADIWTAKEAIYKALGREGLSFKRDIEVKKRQGNYGVAHVKWKGERLAFELYYQTVGNITLCYTFYTGGSPGS